MMVSEQHVLYLPQTYENPDLYDWLLQHHRQQGQR